MSIIKEYPSGSPGVPPIWIVLCDICGDEASPPGPDALKAADLARSEGWLVCKCMAFVNPEYMPAVCPTCCKEEGFKTPQRIQEEASNE